MALGRIEMAFLKSRVARRIFGLFVFCAVIPLLMLSGLTFLFTGGELEKQAVQRLKRTCKAKGFEIYEHLLFLETERRMIASRIERGEPLKAISFVPYASDKGAGTRFLRMALARGTEPFTLLAGDPLPIPEPGSMDTAHLKHGHVLVMTPPGEAPYSVLMVLLIRPEDPESPVLFAEINPI